MSKLIRFNVFCIFSIIISLAIVSCGGDDDQAILNPCEDLVTPPEILITNPTIQVVDDDSFTGYIVSATITNNSSSIISGELSIYANTNGTPARFGSLISCNTLEPNSTCEFLYSAFINSEDLDFSATILCTYYDTD